MKIHNVTPNMQNINNTNKKKVAFSGSFSKGLTNASEKFFNLKRVGTMSLDLFTANAFVFLLGGRLISSRDKNEQRETLTRDIPTILAAVYGVPKVEEFAAKLIQDKKGFAIGEAVDPKKIFGKSRLEVANFSKLDDWYRYDDKLAKGFDSFSERLSSKGGNLKKIYSSLSDKIKNELSNFSKDNKTFMQELSQNAKLKQEIQNEFSKNEGNNALRLARRFKAIPKLIGFALTLAFIGIFIPRLNIHITEKINKNKTARENQESSNKPKSV